MRILKFLGGVAAAVILGLTGAYVLRNFHGTAGLVVGVLLILAAIATALPVAFHDGIISLANGWSTIKPAVTEALGLRKPPDPDK